MDAPLLRAARRSTKLGVGEMGHKSHFTLMVLIPVSQDIWSLSSPFATSRTIRHSAGNFPEKRRNVSFVDWTRDLGHWGQIQLGISGPFF